MVSQWEEAAKGLRGQENNPYVFLLCSKKTKFSSVMSYGLGVAYKDILRNPTLEPRKTGIFKKNIDRIEVDVPKAVVKEGEEGMLAIVRQKVEVDKEFRTKKGGKAKGGGATESD